MSEHLLTVWLVSHVFLLGSSLFTRRLALRPATPSIQDRLALEVASYTFLYAALSVLLTLGSSGYVPRQHEQLFKRPRTPQGSVRRQQ